MTSAVPSTAAPVAGHYAQRHRRAFFLSFSHGARFEYARRAVSEFAGRKLLDYGCGDGTFLGQIREQFPDAVGADLAADQIADCTERFGPSSSIRFVTCDALRSGEYTGRFDIVCCMEVLEHCPAEVVEDVLDELTRLAAPGGAVIISVPVETGPTLFAKQFLRRVAGWLGVPGYRQGEHYSPRDLAKMVFAGSLTKIDRPRYAAQLDGSGGYHGHKGFNWMALRQRIAVRMSIERIAFTPWPWLGRWSNSQVWFHCRVGQRPD